MTGSERKQRREGERAMQADRERTAPKVKVTVEQLIKEAAAVDTEQPDVAAFMSRWADRYSQRNLALLWLQRPGASQLHTYVGWLQAGRKVRHGEKAIRMLAPHTRADPERVTAVNPDGTVIVRVRPICLFDISQTDAVGDGRQA